MIDRVPDVISALQSVVIGSINEGVGKSTNDPVHLSADVSACSADLIQSAFNYFYVDRTKEGRDEIAKNALATAAACVVLLAKLESLTNVDNYVDNGEK